MSLENATSEILETYYKAKDNATRLLLIKASHVAYRKNDLELGDFLQTVAYEENLQKVADLKVEHGYEFELISKGTHVHYSDEKGKLVYTFDFSNMGIKISKVLIHL